MYKSGYSVLLLTIIVSTVGVALAINALINSTQVARTNINITDAVLNKSKALSCVEKVFTKLRAYKFYGGDETFIDGCRVYTIYENSDGTRIIHNKVDSIILETKITQINPKIVIEYQKQITTADIDQNNPYVVDPLALRLWLKADRAEANNGQPVLSVKNATDDLIDFAQLTTQSSLAPKLITNAINNRPALRFDGIDDFLTSTTTSIQNTGLTVITVAKANSTGTNQTYIGKFDASNNEREWILQNDDFTATELATAETANEKISFANNTNLRIISATWAPNQLASVSINTATAINATSPVVASISTTTEPIIVGAHYQGSTGFLNGDIAEILVYNKKLSDAELTKVRTYLNTKYISTNTTLADGSSADKAATSAASLVEQGITTDGVYWINLPTIGPTQVYCILNPIYDGGGWMMAMKATTGTTFNYNSNYWTTANTLNPTDTTRNNADAKFNTMNYFQAKDMMAIWPDISPNGTESGSIDNMSTWTWLENNFNDSTRIAPIDFFNISYPTMTNGGSGKFIRDAKTFSGWASGRFSSQTDIRFYGFNYKNNPTYFGNSTRGVRWGFGWNENGEGLYPGIDVGGVKGSNDVSGGIGMDSLAGNYSAGDYIGCCQDTTGINRSARVEVYIR